MDEEFVEHLRTNHCGPDEEDNPSKQGIFFKNDLRGIIANVPNKDKLGDITKCQICYRLKIPPPEELEDLYILYEQSMRDNDL